MNITKRSPFSGQLNTRDIDITEDQLHAWADGKLIQDAMPNLSADDREFIMTGITPQEWDSSFGENS